FNPARSAADPGATLWITTPGAPMRAVISTGKTRIPIPARGARPVRISSGTTRLTVSTGTANPTPAKVPDGARIAVLTPISRPALSPSGPPEVPGVMAASG